MARFFKFTDEDLEKGQDFTASEWRLFNYLRLIDPFGDTYQELDTLTVLSECDIKKTTFYKAIAKFQELGLFDFQDKGFNFRSLGLSAKTENFPQKRKTVRENGKLSEKADSSLYTEVKTLSDCGEEEKPEGPDNPDKVAIAIGEITEISQSSLMETKNSGEDKFSGARTGKTVQQRSFNWLPDGPWVIDGKLDPNFRDWLAGKWLAEYGKDIHTQRANVLSHFKKDPANLPIRWEQYQGEYLDRFTNTQILLDNGVEIPEEYQETLIANQRALTAELPQEMKAIAPITTPAIVTLPEENSQAYKPWKPQPLPGEPATPEQIAEIQEKINAFIGKVSHRQSSPNRLATQLENLNNWLKDPILRKEAINFAEHSPNFKYCSKTDEIITSEEF